MALLRQVVRNLLEAYKAKKFSIRTSRHKSGWSVDDYLCQVLMAAAGLIDPVSAAPGIDKQGAVVI